jgi:hypothetical protein
MSPEKLVLIIVHGMGQQRRNDSVLGVVRPIIEFMKARGEPGWDPEIRGSLALDRQATAEIGYRRKTWHFAEYWWAEEFRAAKEWSVAWWIVRRLSSHLLSMIRSMWQSTKDLAQLRGNRDPFAARLYNFLATPVFTALVAGLFATTWLLVLLLVALQYVRFIPGAPSFIGYVRAILQVVAVDYVGDIYVYLQDPVQGAQIRGGLREMIEEYARQPEVSRIVLFAHSTGNLLVYDALAFMNHLEKDRVKAGEPGGSTLDKVKAFVSIGSIINMAWNRSILSDSDPRFRREMPEHLHWYHLWTRFDIGPAGPIELDGKPWIYPDSIVNRRVNNYDDLLLDHTGYWGNLEQVHSLLLEEMGGLDQSNDFWRGPGLNPPGAWQSRSAQTWEDFNMRRGAVARLAFVRLLTWPVPVLGFPLMLWFHGWARAIGDFLQLDWLADNVGFEWLATTIGSATLAAGSRVALAALISVVLFGLAFLIVYIGFKQVWWNRDFERLRTARADAFRKYRQNRLETSEP